MSNSRLVAAVRRMVITDPRFEGALDDAKNRGDQASATGVGTSDAARDRVCCDGSTSDNPNPGASTRDTSGGGQDGLNADDPALLDSGPGSLTGVTDCATGEPICFDGGGFIPPDGWDAPNEPPEVEGYEEGAYWLYVIDPYTGYGLNPCLATEDLYRQYGKVLVGGTNDVGVGSCNNFYLYDVGDDPSTKVGPFTSLLSKRMCDHVYNDVCDEDPYADYWPEDGCTNLAIKNGTIVGSKYDPENDGSYSKPMPEIQLCSGGDQIGLKPAKTGLYKTLNATTDSGYLYNSQHEKIAHINGNEYSDPDV